MGYFIVTWDVISVVLFCMIAMITGVFINIIWGWKFNMWVVKQLKKFVYWMKGGKRK